MAYAVRVDEEEALRFVASNLFEMEWPPRSGRTEWFAEMDGAEWMDLDVARRKVVAGQMGVLDQLVRLAATRPGGSNAR